MRPSRWFVLSCAATLACTPKLDGVCRSSSDCRPGESCTASGLCLNAGPPPSITLLSDSLWHSGNASIFATITDPGAGVASASVTLLGGPTVAGVHGTGDVWSFAVDVASAFRAQEGAVPFQLSAIGAAGNTGSASGVLLVDTLPPAIALQPLTGADYVDGAGAAWFQGPTVNPAAPPISITATITEGNLDTTAGNQPVAIVGGTRYAGAAAGGGQWTFSIPRSVGKGAAAPVAVTFDAQDLAGNHPAALPKLELQFDDVVFTPAIAADATWYARGAGVNLAVAVSLAAVPRSGVQSVVLSVTSQPDVPCQASAASSWTCSLPSTYAPAGAEKKLPIKATAKSNTGVSSLPGNDTRLIDDVPPVILAAAAIPYPAAAPSTPLGYSHDGAHYNLREGNIALYRFSAYDCGAGVKAVASSAFSPLPATRSASVAPTSAQAPCGATIYEVTLSADLATVPLDSLPALDGSETLTVSVSDAATDGSGNPNTSAVATKSVAVTRRLWQTGPMSAGTLALGPALAVATGSAIQGLDPATGAAKWSTPAASLMSGPAVGSIGAAAALFYGVNSSSGASLFAVSAVDGSALSSCIAGATPALPPNCGLNSAYSRLSQYLALATDGSARAIEDDSIDADTTGTVPKPCGAEGYTGRALGSTCSNWLANVTAQQASTNGFSPSEGGLVIGRGGQAYFSAKGIAQEVATSVVDLPASAGPAALGTPLLVSDDGGSDAPVSAGQRVVWTGSFTTLWSGAGFAGPALNATGLLVANASGAAQPFSLGSGSSAGLAGTATETPLMIGAGSTPVLYSSSGASLYAQRLGAAGLGAQFLWLTLGGAITDAVMDSAGTIYLSAGGQVTAFASESGGLYTAGNAWPIRGHDACRSWNLEYACPY